MLKNIPTDEIIKLYTIDHLAYNKIAAKYHCTHRVIRKILTNNGVTIQSPNRSNPATRPSLDVKDIIRLYVVEHMPYHDIATKYKRESGTIRKILTDNNIKIREKGYTVPISHNDIVEIIRLYSEEYLSSPEIGRRYGVCAPTVVRWLREYNIPIRNSHDTIYRKDLIDLNKLPTLIRNAYHINHGLTGEVTCPICGKTRRITIKTKLRIADITASNGRCNPCAGKSRAIPLDIDKIKTLYLDNQLTPKQIGTIFHTSDMAVRNLLAKYNIPLRKRGSLQTSRTINKIQSQNKGTLKNPVVGDICRGTDIGLNDPTFYVWVSCQKCHRERWQCKTHIKKSPLCRECSLKLMGENHREENATYWLGGKSFEPYTPEFNKVLKEQIRKRDNYTCQLCGKHQDGIKLAIHHIDYNKWHTVPENLISLCTSPKMKIPGNTNCHNKTNGNRGYWTQYFTELLTKRGIIKQETPILQLASPVI